MSTVPLRTPRALLVAALGLGLLVLRGAGTVTAGPPAAANLPPSEERDLARLFRAELKPLGLKVSRGLLQHLETYEADAKGTHLALYVEPVDRDYSSAEYVENFTTLTRMFVPKVFERWKGLESFDICQEPYADPRESPPPVTQIFLTRSALDRVGSWRKAELPELLAASPRVRSVSAGYYVYFSPTVRTDPAFIEAAKNAGWLTRSGPDDR